MLDSFASRILRFPDANLDGGSSSTSADSGETGSNSSAGSSDGIASSSDTQVDNAEPTSMADAIKAALANKGVVTKSDSSSESAETEDKEQADKSRSENEQDQLGKEKEEVSNAEDEKGKEKEGEETEGEEGEKESKTGDEHKAADDTDTEAEKPLVKGKPVPYDRFEEVNTQRQQLRQQLESVTPKVQNYDQIDSFCRQNGITPQQFQQVLEVQALLNTNPVEARKRLQPIMDSLDGLTGDKLSTEIQAAVDAGDITLKYAKELAKSRAELQFGQKKFQHDQQSLQQQQEQLVQRQLADSTSAWEATKRQSDPSYKPKSKASEPDGKWELCKTTFLGMLHETDARGNPLRPIDSPQKMVALLEEAYQKTDTFIKRLTSKPATSKRLRSSGSSGSSSTGNGNNNDNSNNRSIESAPTMQEAIRRGLALSR